jgi:hypothetical protein
MSTPTTRTAIVDTLHRCLFGLDSNNHALFASACLQTPSMTIIAGPITLTGWTDINAYFQRLFDLVTTHMTSNIRVELNDEEGGRAKLTANCMSYHVKPEDAMKVEDTSYTASSLYFIDLVEDGEGEWKIEKWEIKVLWTTGDIGILHG